MHFDFGAATPRTLLFASLLTLLLAVLLLAYINM
jgi:hypothetical protein